MIELDQMWSQMIDEASRRARADGRHDVADYLDLKAGNDALRSTGVRWLLETIIESAMAEEARIKIEREEPHNFAYRGANLVGSRIRMRYGVRCLTIEAGWTRTPADGFMRGGALAVCRISHFGMPKYDHEILLRKPDGTPAWYLAEHGQLVESAFLMRQVAILLADA